MQSENSAEIILFGAGRKGLEALDRFGLNKVAFFCDNNKEKQGKKISGKDIVSFDELVKKYNPHKHIIIITLVSPGFVIGQLEKAGILYFLLYKDKNPQIVEYNGKENEGEKTHNDFLRKYVFDSSKNDLLESVEEFKELTTKAIEESNKRNISLNYLTRGKEEEGYRYGNLQTLLRFADIKRIEGNYIPIVSHVMSLPLYSPKFRYKTSVIFAGEYYKKYVHEIAPWVPVFTVGPYIQYSKGIYNENIFKIKKEKIGKMLLVFLPHTLENTSRGFDRRIFIDRVKSQYGDSFDQIWLCVYFADINEEVCEYAQKIGIHIVSAGFRFDPFFNDRLKTIIQLADAVVCGDIGGFLAYSMFYKKPIARIEISDNTSGLDVQYDNQIELNLEKTEDYINFEKDFYTLFTDELRLTKEQLTWMDSLVGFNISRDKEYISKVFDISGKIWDLSGGNERKYPEAVREAFYYYNDKDDFERMFILRQAVGTYLD